MAADSHACGRHFPELRQRHQRALRKPARRHPVVVRAQSIRKREHGGRNAVTDQDWQGIDEGVSETIIECYGHRAVGPRDGTVQRVGDLVERGEANSLRDQMMHLGFEL